MDEDAARWDEEPMGEDALIDHEVVDGVIVLAGARAVEQVRPAGPPLRQVAAVAATGFVAGAATAAVLGRHRARRRERLAPAPAPEAVGPVVARFLVYVR